MTITQLDFWLWAKSMKGKTVRGRAVEFCDMTIDDNGTDGQLRVFLGVQLREPAFIGGLKHPEEKMLARVFDDASNVQTRSMTVEQAIDVLRGRAEPEWFLDDEVRA